MYTPHGAWGGLQAGLDRGLPGVGGFTLWVWERVWHLSQRGWDRLGIPCVREVSFLEAFVGFRGGLWIREA